MEGESSWWLLSLQFSFSFAFFSFTFAFFIISFSVYFLRLRPWCNCDICHTYLTSRWSIQFDNLCDWYAHLLRNSPNRTIHVHVLGNTITGNPANVEYVLKTKFENYPKGKPFQTILGDLLGNGIFNVDGDRWMFQRKMASLELGSVSVRSFAFQVITTEIHHRLLPLLASFAAAEDRNKVFDLQDVFRRFSFDNICRISFGIDPKCLELSLPMSEFAMAFDVASTLSAKRAVTTSPLIWKIKRVLNIGSEKKLRDAIKMVKVLAEEVIRQRRKTGYSTRQDLLSRFMTTVNDDTYLRDIVISFLLAGRDAVASGLTAFFLLISSHPNAETSIREELAKVMSEGEDVATFDQIKEMNYLHGALYEAMRLYPPVQFDSKYALDDDVLPDGTFIRKGTRVTYHPYAMGRLEELWGPDCLEFKPDRWLKNGVFTPESPFKYPVFQAGLRVCLGKELSLLEMKSVAVSLLRRFKIDALSPHRSPKFAPGLTATMTGGLPARIRILEDEASHACTQSPTKCT